MLCLRLSASVACAPYGSMAHRRIANELPAVARHCVCEPVCVSPAACEFNKRIDLQQRVIDEPVCDALQLPRVEVVGSIRHHGHSSRFLVQLTAIIGW